MQGGGIAVCREEGEGYPLLPRLPELEDELVRLAADGAVELLLRVIVGRIGEDYAFARIDEARRFHFLFHDGRIDSMECVGVAKTRACFGRVIENDVNATGLQRVIDRLVHDG